MSESLFAAAIRGARTVLDLTGKTLDDAIARKGAAAPLAYPETAYELPVAFGFTDVSARTLADGKTLLAIAASLLRDEPTAGNALDAGAATLVGAEVLAAVSYGDGNPYAAPSTGFVHDAILRKLGIFLVDGSVPGVAVFVGKADDVAKAAEMVRLAQEAGLLVFLAGDVVGQLDAAGVRIGDEFRTFALGPLPAVIHAVNFAVRAGLTFGGLARGQANAMWDYLANRVKAFVVALGDLDDVSIAVAAGAMKAGFPVFSDRQVPEIPGLLRHHAPGEELVRSAMEARGIKVKIVKIPIPVAFGPAYEGERIRKGDVHAEFGGGRSTAYELVEWAQGGFVTDREIVVDGKDLCNVPKGTVLPLGIVVRVAGSKMQKDFESVLERRVHRIVNMAEGIMHIAQRDATWIRVSDEAVAKGFRLEHIGLMLHAKLHADFEKIVDRVSVTITTDLAKVEAGLAKARAAYAERDARMLTLTDDAVGEFYSCTLCQSFAPAHVCVVSPERLGLCGAINWLDGKAGYEIVPTGPNQPVAKGTEVDASKGEWAGVNDFVNGFTRGAIPRMTLYSLMDAPMTSCGCFEAIIALVPEANGVMIVHREFTGDATPCGMGFSTLAGSVGGGVQTPGFMGIGKQYLLSKKFLLAEGGIARIVWMPKELKETLGPALAARAAEEGVPGLLDQIADETTATTPDELVEHLTRVGHPALAMPPIF